MTSEWSKVTSQWCTVTAVEHAVTTVEQFDTTVSMVTPQWITVTAKLTTLRHQIGALYTLGEYCDFTVSTVTPQ